MRLDEYTYTFTADQLAEILADAEIEIRVGGPAPGITNPESLADYVMDSLADLQ